MQCPRIHPLPRLRITTALEDALKKHCLVVLTAPMGYGKTTLAQELIGRHKKRCLYLAAKPAWQSSVDYLWSEACSRLLEQGAADAGPLKLMGVPDDDARLYRRLGFCRKCLSATPTLLVIDDYHHVRAPEIDRFLAGLVREEIPGFNILLLSRTRPDLSLEYLQLKGHAAVFGHTFAAFTREEAGELFRLAGEPRAEPADRAWEFTEGWPAALRICLHSHMSDGIATPVRGIAELLTEGFFFSYPAEDQKLLLQVAVLETFSTEQAVFLCAEKEAAPRLRALREHNAFLQYYSATDTYTIQPLFRSYLLARLAENALPVCADIDVVSLYRRAGECRLQMDDPLQAIRFFAQAGQEEDQLRILRMFESPGEGIFIIFDPEGVAGIINDIPWSIRLKSPVGYLGFVHRYLVRVGGAQADAMLEEASARFLAQGALLGHMHDKIRGETALVLAAQSFNDIEAMCRRYEEADALLQGQSSLVNEDMFWTFNCPHSAFLYLKKPGTYTWLRQLVEEKLEHFRNVSSGSNAGAADLLFAEQLLETGEAQKALHPLKKAEYKAEGKKQHPVMLAAAFTRARVDLALGQAENAFAVLEAMREPLEKLGNPLLLHTLDVCNGYVAAVCNKADRIPAWLLRHEQPRVRITQTEAFSFIVRGKALMAKKQWPQLEALAEDAERQFSALDSLFCRLHIHIFKAVVSLNSIRNSTARAESHLNRALDLAAKDGIVTGIAEYGAHLYPLLQRMNNIYPHKKELVLLGRLTKKYARLGKEENASLTLHEMDIMKMVAAGASNRDIGKELGITSGSTANNLSRIYTKLGVGSRIEAIHKWEGQIPASSRTPSQRTG